LVANITESNGTNIIENIDQKLSINDIVIELRETTIKAKKLGDTELYYLTSIALESAKEKLFLQMYDNC
jgi:hypothetical protein